MTNQLNKTTTIFAITLMVLFMITTRGHDNWLSSFVHLPDFTIPALFIAGVYFRQLWVAFTLILSALVIDNYTIVHQGISANCITPAYSLLPLTYYGIFWSGKYISALLVDKNIVKNSLIIIATVFVQWFIATISYYAFTISPWVKFPTYVAHWSVVEIPLVLYWMVAVVIVFTFVSRISLTFSTQKSV